MKTNIGMRIAVSLCILATLAYLIIHSTPAGAIGTASTVGSEVTFALLMSLGGGVFTFFLFPHLSRIGPLRLVKIKQSQARRLLFYIWMLLNFTLAFAIVYAHKELLNVGWRIGELAAALLFLLTLFATIRLVSRELDPRR